MIYFVSNLGLGWNFEQDDTSGHVLMLGNPVAQVVVAGRPLKVHDVRNLDALFVEQRERLRFVDEQRVRAETCEILVVEVPFEVRPDECYRAFARERALLLTRSHAPDDQRLVVHARSIRVARDQVVLAGREVDELHAVMRKSRELIELFARPKRNASIVECGQVRAFRRPLETGLGPFLFIAQFIQIILYDIIQQQKTKKSGSI